jgi:hypothetical protein
MNQYILLLSDISYSVGLIGLAEYDERYAIAQWLSSSDGSLLDPRGATGEAHEQSVDPTRVEKDAEGMSTEGRSGASVSNERNPDDHWPTFRAFNKWLFTIGDRDCYPSVPHGHLHTKTNAWPKLNPYTGRVFTSVQVESVGDRLSMADMKVLWNDENFIDLCRKQVQWYSEFAPAYEFRQARFGKYIFPRWP